MIVNIVTAFESEGFVVARNLLNSSCVDEVVLSIKHSFDNVLNDVGVNLGDSVQDSMQKLYLHDVSKYMLVASSLWRKLQVSDLLHNELIRKFIFKNFGWSDIYLPGGQVVHIMDKRLVPPNGYHGISSHQDWPSVMGSLDGMVIWVPLMDIDRNLYPLEVIPGSHRGGMLAMKNDPERPWEIDESSYDASKFMPVEVQKGDVVFMSYFCVHRSSLNGNGLRLACSTRYDNANEQSFISRVYPTAYTRGVNRLFGQTCKDKESS